MFGREYCRKTKNLISGFGRICEDFISATDWLIAESTETFNLT